MWGSVGITPGDVLLHDSMSTVRSLLRPSENLQCILDVELVARTEPPPDRTDPLRRRLIAVVTHRAPLQDVVVGRWVPQYP